MDTSVLREYILNTYDHSDKLKPHRLVEVLTDCVDQGGSVKLQVDQEGNHTLTLMYSDSVT